MKNWNNNEWQGRSERQANNNQRIAAIAFLTAVSWIVVVTLFQLVRFLINWLDELIKY